METKTVLLADDDRELVEALATRCRELGVTVQVAYDARSALQCACQSRPDVICLDVKMPAGSGLSVCEMLANDEELTSIPVIMLTGMTDHETIRRCHTMGAYYVLKSGTVWQRLCPILCELLGMESPVAHPYEPRHGSRAAAESLEPPRHGLDHLVAAITQAGEGADADRGGRASVNGSPARAAVGASAGEPAGTRPAIGESDQTPRRTVLYIEDDVEASGAMKIRLESLGLSVVQAFDGVEGYRLAVARGPDLIVCDYMLPGGDGDYVLRRLRENPATESIPVIFITGRSGSELPRRLYGEGAAGYLKKPVSREDLVEALSAALDMPLHEQEQIAR